MKKGTLFLLVVLFFPQVARSQYFFPKIIEPGEWGATGYAVVNPNDTSVAVRFSMLTTDGVLLGSFVQVIPPGGQFARLGAELFPTVGSAGWVQLRSNAPVDAFWVGGDFSTFADGGGAASVSMEQLLPLAAGETEIHIANAASVANPVTIRLLDESGSDLANPVTRILASNGGLKALTSEIFPSGNMTRARTVRIKSAISFASTSVVRGFLVPTETASLNGVDAASSAVRLNFPHVVAGVVGAFNYTTVLGATNLSNAPQNIVLTFHPEPSGDAVSVTRTVPAGGSVRDSAQTLFSLPASFQDGWVDIASSAPITGFAAYAETTSGGLAVVPVQETPQARLVFAHIAGAPFWYSGAALLNTSSQDAIVEVFAMTPGGELIGGAANEANASFILAAGRKSARLLSDLIPAAAAQNGGFIFVRTTNNVPLFGMELFGSQNGKILANVPGVGLPRGINYEPPPASSPSVAPTIAIQPSNVTAVFGQSATFTVTSRGGAPLTYVWQKNGVVIDGATSASYSTPPVDAADNGAVFAVTISNPFGSATSVAAVLAVSSSTGFIPVIDAQPVAHISANLGNRPVLSVTANGAALTYQWRRNGIVIAGATGSTYTAPPVTAADSHATFSVLVCASGGCRTSSNTTMHVVNSATSPVIQIDAGTQQSFALRQDGTAWGWGTTSDGRIGLARPTTYPVQQLPVGVVDNGDLLFPKITRVESAFRHTLFLRSDGTVWATGINSNGELGTANNDAQSAPAMVLTSTAVPLSDVRAIHIGITTSYAITSDSQAWAWGNNSNGQLGDGTTISRNRAIRVLNPDGSPFKGVTAVASSGNHTLWLKDDGTVWAAGSNVVGKLGDGTNTDRFYPVRAEVSPGVPLTGIISVVAAYQFSMALRSDGKIFIWGNENGRGWRPEELTDAGVPPIVASLAGSGQGTRGGGAIAMLLPTGTMVMAGDNQRGILGVGHTNLVSGYVTVLNADLSLFTNVQSFSLADSMVRSHVVARKSDGSVWTWGENESGQTGGSGLFTASPLRVQGLTP